MYERHHGFPAVILVDLTASPAALQPVPLPAWCTSVLPGANQDHAASSLRLMCSSPIQPPLAFDYCFEFGQLHPAERSAAETQFQAQMPQPQFADGKQHLSQPPADASIDGSVAAEGQRVAGAPPDGAWPAGPSPEAASKAAASSVTCSGGSAGSGGGGNIGNGGGIIDDGGTLGSADSASQGPYKRRRSAVNGYVCELLHVPVGAQIEVHITLNISNQLFARNLWVLRKPNVICADNPTTSIECSDVSHTGCGPYIP